MTHHEASEVLEHMLDTVGRHAPGSRDMQVLILAKQALEILAVLENGLHLREPVTIENCELEWKATRGGRTHLGSDVTDALEQLCATLALEER